jgi:transposase
VRHHKYAAIIPRDRQRIVECSNRGEDWKTLSESLGIKYKTAYAWIRSGEPACKARGGKKPRFLNDQQIDMIITWIEEKCDLSLKDIQRRILREFGVNISVSTVGNYLEGRSFTIKQTHHQPESMNTLPNKQLRRAYVITLNQYIREGKDIIWIDETNFNLFCRRSQGRSRAGTRAIQTMPTSRGPNIHLIGAVSANAVLRITLRRGSFKNNDCNTWMTDLLQHYVSIGKDLTNLVVVCDNAPCHSRLEQVFGENGAILLRLGPYSPMLNPIENIWSVIKTEVKGNIRVPQVVPPNVGEQRLLYLENIIENSKLRVTDNHCVRAYQHTTTFHGDIMALLDVPVGM